MHDTKSNLRIVPSVEVGRQGVRQSIASAITNLRRSEAQTALALIEALADCSANMGARHLLELCSQLASWKLLENADSIVSEFVEAHRTLTRDMEEIYPVFRYERGGSARCGNLVSVQERRREV